MNPTALAGHSMQRFDKLLEGSFALLGWFFMTY